MPMTAAAIGVLAAAARTETKPNAAMTPGSSPAAWARATPLVAPMKNSGVTMPPLPPVSRVTLVATILNRKASANTFAVPSSEASMVGRPRPAYSSPAKK